MPTQHNTTQHNTTQHNTTQHNTTQHNTTQHNTTQHNTTGRLPQFEIFRLLLMFFIVIWHSIVHGMQMSTDNFPVIDPGNITNNINLFVICAFTSLTAVAVNCYVIMTGYFMTNATNINWTKIGKLWFQVFFYSILIVLIFGIFTDIDSTQIKLSVLPIYHNSYWFITKYLLLIALAPFLAIIPRHISRNQFGVFLLILLFCNLCLINRVFPFGKLYSDQNHILWFITLFYTGNYIRRFSLPRLCQHSGKLYFFSCFVVFAILVSKAIKHGSEMSNYIPIYNGFTYFSSVFLFLWVTTLNIKSNALMTISRLSPTALAIYLIHDNNIVSKHLWNTLNLNSFFDETWFSPLLIGVALVIFISCIAIEYCRLRLFKRYKINELFLSGINLLVSSFTHIVKRRQQ